MVKRAAPSHPNDLAGRLGDIQADAAVWARAAWAWLKALPRVIWDHLRRLPRVAQWSIGAALTLVVAIILFLANPNWDWARGFVSTIIAGRVHRPTRIDGHLRVHLFSFTPNATAGGLVIGQPDWAGSETQGQDLANIGSLAVTAELAPLFIGRIVLPRLQVDRPVVYLLADKDGRANWDFSNGANKGKPTKLPPIKNFIINEGHLTVINLQHRLQFTGTVDAHERADSGRSAFALTGDGDLNGKKFQMLASGGPLLNVRTSTPYPFNMTVMAGDTKITAKGRVLHPFDLGQVDAAMSISGRNLGDLYYLTSLTFPDTPAYHLTANVTRNVMVYDINRINGKIGGSDLEGKLKVDTRDHGRPNLTGNLSSRLLDFKDLGTLFGATAANAPTAPKMDMSPMAPQAARRLLPDVPLDVERVRGMDAKVHYRALSVHTSNGMPLNQVSLGITLDHGLMTLDPIDFIFPRGHLIGSARIDARNAVQQDSIDMRLTGLAVQDFAPKFAGASPIDGMVNARIKASGTGNTMHKAASSADGRLTIVMPGGTVRQSLAELMGVNATKGLFQLLTKDPHQTDVRCAIADFSVTNGVMQAQSIVFDTGVVQVNGTGSVNLNDESLRLKLQGKPKKFRLVHVDAPILIGGHLTAPKIGISADKAIVQGGLALVFHTLLPFIGTDYAKDANCGALLAEAKAEGTPLATRAVRSGRK